MNSSWLLNPVKCVNNLSSVFGVVDLESRWETQNVCIQGILQFSSNLLQMSSSYVCVFRKISSGRDNHDTFSFRFCISSSSSVLHWFSFSKADLLTGWTVSCLSLFHENIEGTASAFNRFLLEYGLKKSSDVKCSRCRFSYGGWRWNIVDLFSFSRSKQREDF